MEIFRTVFNPTWKLNKLLYCAIKKIFRQKFIRLAVSQIRRRKKRWVFLSWVALSPISWSKICLLTLLSILYAIKIDLQHIFYTLDLFLEKKNVKREKEFAKRWQNSKILPYILYVYVATYFTPVNSTTFLGALNNYSASVSQLFSPKENWNATIHIFEISWKI